MKSALPTSNIKYRRLRNNTYYFLYNIPTHRRGGAQRQIWRSLNTSDPMQALVRMGPFIQEFVLSEGLIGGEMSQDVSYTEYLETAKKVKVPPYEAHDVERQSVQEAIAMIGPAIVARQLIRTPSKAEVAAIGGAIEAPALTLKDAFSRFKALHPEKVFGLNPVDAKRKWRRYEEAVDDFCDQMGQDIDVLKLKNRDAFDYRAKLVQRVSDGEFKSDAANKKLGWLRIVIKAVFESDYPEQRNPFEKVKITHLDDDEKRQAFDETEVKNIRKELARSAMSDEAKTVALLGECTGAGAKELLLLLPDDICLDAPIPYIRIGENKLRAKVKGGGSRHREVPIVCPDALSALRNYPNGFEKFHDPQGPTRMNRALSDFFKKVVPGKGHYSYRHRLDDLLKASGCDLGLKTAISGHTMKGEGHEFYYGKGRGAYTLSDKKEALKKAIEHAN